MGELLQKITNHQEAILLGEIGALLHMFGKCSLEFLVANSQEGGAQDRHTQLDWMSAGLRSCLENLTLTNSFAFQVGGHPETLSGHFTDFITQYKRTGANNPVLLRLFNTCHRMTSADEKGVVRKKQSQNDMRITTPFGYSDEAHKVDLDTVDAVRTKMDCDLAKILDAYLKGDLDIDGLHDQAVDILEGGMSQALGETRQPANDVTLWGQSHGVASLYKPVLATLAMGLDPSRKSNGELDYNNVRWRLLGIGWNGLGFVQSGRRPGDILRRQEILQDIRDKLQRLLEVEYPLGNLFYEDLNGLFFTFPGLDNQDAQAEALFRELGPEIVATVRGQSDKELWPFLTLSRPRRTLTTITREIQARDRLAALPRVAALLSLEREEGEREEKLLADGPVLSPPTAGQDICPVCQFRSKGQREDACQVCQYRRSHRQHRWQGARQGKTIWIDEVADTNNRMALLTLRFDLSRWLNGEWLTTLWSQTLEDWSHGGRLASESGQVVSSLRDLVTRNEIEVSEDDLYGSACSFATWVLNNPARTECKAVLEAFLEPLGGNYDVDEVPTLLQEIEETYGARDAESILKFFFTQNASPARLRRIWKATECFLDSLIEAIESETFAVRPQRLHFTVTTRLAWVQPRQTYRITVPGLRPATLTVLCLDSGEHCRFLTVASPDKFHFPTRGLEAHGISAVQAALETVGISEWRDEETGQSISGATSIPGRQVQGFSSEAYMPFIVFARSPAFCQLLLPAERTPDVLRQLLDLTDKHFAKVQGKLPLHASLLVANRRFPLYALLEAGQLALDHPSFNEGSVGNAWWDEAAHTADPFYGYYPTKAPCGGSWAITDLAPVNQASQFWLTPGYFDFDFLGSTADRHNLVYQGQAGRLVRSSIAYGPLQPRPTTLHRLGDLLKVWKIVSKNLGPAQRHHLEEALSAKLEEWEAMGWIEIQPIFEVFGDALLKQTFTRARWDALSPGQRSLLGRSLSDGLLLEALELFQHVVKEETSNG